MWRQCGVPHYNPLSVTDCYQTHNLAWDISFPCNSGLRSPTNNHLSITRKQEVRRTHPELRGVHLQRVETGNKDDPWRQDHVTKKCWTAWTDPTWVCECVLVVVFFFFLQSACVFSKTDELTCAIKTLSHLFKAFILVIKAGGGMEQMSSIKKNDQWLSWWVFFLFSKQKFIITGSVQWCYLQKTCENKCSLSYKTIK